MRQSDGKHFGQRLREARVAAGLSQSELEDISGIPKARLSRYENGHVEPSIQTLARLSRALNVSEASLLGDQRAILEDFFQILYDRGVRITSSDQGARIAHAIADLLQALAVKVDSAEADETTSFPPASDEQEQALVPQVFG
ncbi:MAG: helix-turn-helix domain-containing protein [Actinomycetota bacterium]|nr:helix-turn-helix domain-containing protein [Actinomycetota bacterium]